MGEWLCCEKWWERPGAAVAALLNLLFLEWSPDEQQCNIQVGSNEVVIEKGERSFIWLHTDQVRMVLRSDRVLKSKEKPKMNDNTNQGERGVTASLVAWLLDKGIYEISGVHVV